MASTSFNKLYGGDSSHTLHSTACERGSTCGEMTDAAKADKKGGLGGRKALKGKIGVAKAKKKGGLIGRKCLKGKVGRKALSDITDGVKEIALNARLLACVREEINSRHEANCSRCWKESLEAIPSHNEDVLMVDRMIGKLFASARESFHNSLMAKAYDLDERPGIGRVFSLTQADDDEDIESDDNVN